MGMPKISLPHVDIGGILSGINDAAGKANKVLEQIPGVPGPDKSGNPFSGPSASAAAPATAAPAASATPSMQTMDPLAMQLFFTQAIAPMLQSLASGLQTQNKGLADYAQHNLEHFQMPAQYKALFGQDIPRNAAAQNDVIASLTGAAASGLALDQLMANVTAQRQAAQKAYYEELLGQVTNNPFGAALNGLPTPTQPATTTSGG